MVQSGRVDVDAFGRFGMAGADELSAEQLPAGAVAGDADSDRRGAGVVGLVIVGRTLRGDGRLAGGGGFVVAQPGPGGDQVEHLDDLGAEAAAETS
jgi:hypothetical protein